ncbi:MAG: DUF4154 domain-containing protein [Bacteroidia bacterium]|nr:DUF4154 domain-containing protein [Bacteroidia bacterium]
MKAETIFNIGINVTWKKEKKFTKFRIGTIGRDSSMYSTLKILCKFRLLKWKPIETVYFSNIDSVREVNILYASPDMNDSIEVLNKKIKNYNTLLVTDGNSNIKQSMINFLPDCSLAKIEINEKNIKNQGLKISSVLKLFSKQFHEDWESLYMKTDTLLQLEKMKVEDQRKELAMQQKEIDARKIEIDKLNTDIIKQKNELGLQKEELKKLNTNILLQEKILNEKIKILDEQDKKIKIQYSELSKQEKELKTQKEKITKQDEEYSKQSERSKKQKDEISKQQREIAEQNTILSKSFEQIKKQQLALLFFIIVVVLILGLVFFIYRSYKTKKRANLLLQIKNDEISRQKEEIEAQRDRLSELNEELLQQKEEITSQRDEIEKQRDEITLKNTEITSSIYYAHQIQQIVLPGNALMSSFFSDYFIFYKPKDIVSGDFYWSARVGEKILFAVADCTGHGVPGAIMSMLGIAFLQDIINKKEITCASVILDELRDKIIASLQQKGVAGENQDGMDIALCVWDQKQNEIQFAGANNPVYIVETGESPVSTIRELRPDKMPAAIHLHMRPFTNHSIKIEKGNIVYLFSDGFADQFGGPRGKKYFIKNFCKLISDNSSKPLAEQKAVFENALHSWMNDYGVRYEQTDDITIMGIKL